MFEFESLKELFTAACSAKPKAPYTDAIRLEHAEQQAKDRGCEIVLPQANELFIDIDSWQDHQTFLEISRMLRDQGTSFLVTREEPSKSGGDRYHLVVELDRDVTPLERICLQAILGSDRKREALSWLRLQSGATEHPTLFFEPKF